MKNYIIRRLLQLIPVLLGISIAHLCRACV